MTRRWVVVPVLVLAACGGGGRAGMRATTVPAVTSAPTTAAPATTGAATTTSAPATTTTEAATTTTVSLEAELRAAVEANYRAYGECFADPADCHPEQFATGETLRTIRATVRDMIGFDLYSAPSDDPERVVVTAITFSPDAAAATIDLCHWDTGIVYGRAATPGEPPLVVNDEKASRWHREVWQLQDGKWMAASVVESAPKVVGEDRCGA